MYPSIKPESFLPLSPVVYHILLVLADGERHGYSIMREIARLTRDQLHMGAGTLYRSIKKMQEDQLIEEVAHVDSPGESGDERRRYYRLTDFGKKVAHAETRRLVKLVAYAQSKEVLEAQNLK